MSESDQVNGGTAAPAAQASAASSPARHVESALKAQRAELARMMQELKLMQDTMRSQQNEELEGAQREIEQLRRILAEQDQQCGALQQENDQLRHLLREADQEKALAVAAVEEATQQSKGSPILESLIEEMRAEIDGLREKLKEREEEVQKIRDDMFSLPAEIDADSLEAELIRFRQQLEVDRKALGKEMTQLRERNEELEEARREMELELSRERAELSRERIHLERMREEVRQDMERVQRDSEVRERLAPVQQLRERKSSQQPGGRPASMPSIALPQPGAPAESNLMNRLRNIRKGLNQ
jgi:DNA repair exonuclease SbcCD ATPase subunit